ncbi:hypothetical protein IAI18_07570 [Acetobacteraceae bacterium H6797]|nr:hypothetical protein [Acetobacteraceae bacterium H6797]
MVARTLGQASGGEDLHPLLEQAEAAGVALYVEDGRLRWRAAGPPPEALLAALRADRDAVMRAVMARRGPEASTTTMQTPKPAPDLPEGMPRIERGGMTAERVARAYLAHPMAVVETQPDGWVQVSLPDGRVLYVGPGVASHGR